MKTTSLRSSLLAVSAVAALALSSGNVGAQDSSTASAPKISYGVAQILKLEQAKVGDSVIINYVQNSGMTYDLKADEIVYLKQQGVSDGVLNAMMNQRPPVAGPSAPATASSAPASPSAASYSANSGQATTASAPPMTYIQQQPAQPSTVYVVPSPQAYYYPAPAYYPYYGGSSYWPPISLSFAWGSYGGGHGGGWHHH